MAFFYVAIVVSVFCSAFHIAPLILIASFWGGLGGRGETYPFLYPALLVVLFWLAFPNVSLLIVCFFGVVHMSQPVVG